MATLASSPTGLVDDALVCYDEWREDADAVGTAYEKWCTSTAADSARRYAAYTAALDQEQNAARTYEQAMTRLDSLMQPTAGRFGRRR